MRIKKGNVELDINEDFVQSYLNQGYDIIDSNGKIVKSGNEAQTPAILLKYDEAKKRINELIAETNELKAEIAKLKANMKPADKPVKPEKKK